MNQVDSSSFDDEKDDDKKPKEWFQDWVNKFKIKFNFKLHEKIQESREVWFQDSRKEIKKISQGKYWKDFSKNKHNTVLFFKNVFLKIF